VLAIQYPHTIAWKYGEGIGKAEEPKKVVVIGAGPGGLEAAYRCAMRGHEVELYEKSGELCGGQIMAAKASPGKDILNNIPKFYEAALERMDKVHIHLNTEVTEKIVQNMEADAVILATGGHPFVPGIPGIKECKRVVTGPDVLTKKATVTGKVLIAGGGQAGIETAYQLLTEGYEVSIIEMLPELALNEEGMTKMMIMPILEKLGLKAYVSHQILRVNESSLTAKDLKENKEVEIPFDTLVMALGTRPTNTLALALEAKFGRVYLVGDADHAGNIRSAIESGFFTAMKV
jgi:pyruvate/2-oxoglutarate dehydrogenase complex dihydrolipoamide dehydrogenase (E3) component